MNQSIIRQFLWVLVATFLLGGALFIGLERKKSVSSDTLRVEISDAPDSEDENVFTPPVYETKSSSEALVAPLFLPTDVNGAVDTTEGTRNEIAEFKAKVLKRVSSGVPLTQQEKGVLKASISVLDRQRAGALVVADQTLLQFTEEEIVQIENVLTQ
ncbi:hypothetical protein COU76_04200 [Candidatus Peregrinibacteria bacterium CG10_big_fil_rev_8_21_14_0_10_49_10]|nr:MAG: hypothetical protein COU76_04200 [Candidatus Peregrinibacteria bacterium CG10_big_fil_rev_8_21_14_0_10_49_10]